MESFFLNPHLFPLFTFFIGGILLLMVNGLASHRSLVGRISSWVGGLLCLALATAGIVAATFQLHVGFWLPALLLAGIYFFVALLPSAAGKSVLAFAARVFATPRGRALAILLSCGLATGISLVVTLNSLTNPPEYDFAEDNSAQEDVNLAEVDSTAAFTDKGRRIVLKTSQAANAGHLDERSLQLQFAMLGTHGLRDQVIHVPVGWQNTNCHGWVFTGGQFWVTSDQVDRILHDNRYQSSTAPKSGDVAVYRTPESGVVTHTGIVRYVSPSGDTILVESKWGRMGRFIHRHDTHCYGLDECTFYRSARNGHRLKGLPTDSAAPSQLDIEWMERYTPTHTSSGVVRF